MCWQTEVLEQSENFRVKIDGRAFDCAGPVKDNSEWSLRDRFWIEMLQRTGCGIARIRKYRKSRGFAFLIEFLEPSLVQISFAAHFENAWRVAAQLVRH